MGGVWELIDTTNDKMKHHVGRQGFIFGVNVFGGGKVIVFGQDDGHGYMRTSIIRKVEEQEGGFLEVWTLNSVYTFKRM